MAVRKVLQMGNPNLLKTAVNIDDPTSLEVQDILTDMFDTMHELGGIGIAAPQIDISKRVIIFGFDSNPRYPDAAPVPITVLINPSFTPLSEDKNLGWEGCLSVPNLRGVVPRYTHIRYTGYDQQGNLIDIEAKDMHARVVQHEIDHLNGILFPMRIEDMRLLGYKDEVWDWVLAGKIPEF